MIRPRKEVIGNPHWFPSASELRLIERAVENGGWTAEQIARQLNAPVDKVRRMMVDARKAAT